MTITSAALFDVMLGGTVWLPVDGGLGTRSVDPRRADDIGIPNRESIRWLWMIVFGGLVAMLLSVGRADC